jgi:hypothetical protein
MSRLRRFIDVCAWAIPPAVVWYGGCSLPGPVLDNGPAAAQEAPKLDSFGGIRVKVTKPGGSFRTTKVGNRWVLVTPEGNAFWMLGVYNVDIATHRDDRGGTYRDRVIAKYGDADITWGPQQVRRLRAWGFNTLGEYANKWTQPWTTFDKYGSSWDRGGRAPWPNPIQMPAIPISSPAWYSLRNLDNLAPGAVKELMRATDGHYRGYRGRFPDVFDPNFETWVRNDVRRIGCGSPWVLGICVDDTDYLTGFGPGPDFETGGKTHPHLGYIVLITPPTQAESKEQGVKYGDTRVHTKFALAAFLQRRYGTVAALNAAWGSDYTTWESDGGWPAGKGFLDENGKGVWVGSDAATLGNTARAVKADLDDFLYELARRYFTTVRTQVKQHCPNTLYLGPTTVGGWDAPPRRQILKAAGESVDLLRTTWSGQQDRLDFIAEHAGDVPVAVWSGAQATADSALFRYPARALPTQAVRGEFYEKTLTRLFDAKVTRTGTHPFVGLQWWEFHDNFGEKANWGLVTLSDNAYDGKEAVRAHGKDPWGFKIGGEERDYGDFLSAVVRMNRDVLVRLRGELERASRSETR